MSVPFFAREHFNSAGEERGKFREEQSEWATEKAELEVRLAQGEATKDLRKSINNIHKRLGSSTRIS